MQAASAIKVEDAEEQMARLVSDKCDRVNSKCDVEEQMARLVSD